MLEMKKFYVLNPAYMIRADKKRAILYNTKTDPFRPDGVSEFLGLIHPLFAIILAHFDGKRSLEEVINRISNLVGLNISGILKLISPLINNTEDLEFAYDGNNFMFPRNLIIDAQPDTTRNPIDIKQFMIPKTDLDFNSWRLYVPLDLQLMVNTKCLTDCIYCYADRSRKMDLQIEWPRLREIIHDAKKTGIRGIDLTGGELFLHREWEKLLLELVSNDFYPYITTKIPITQEDIAKLKDIGIKRIQISLDSIKKEELVSILKVKPDYIDRIKETLSNLDNAEIKIYINTQVTQINKNSIKELMEYLLNLKNIKRINVGAAGYSLYYRENYQVYNLDLKNAESTKSLIERYKEERLDILINYGDYIKLEEMNAPIEEKRRLFASRARCSANFYGMVVLPDGKVTICEELYWHPRFIIGDLNRQSLMEVWNSKEALDLYQLNRETLKEVSACKTCQEFDGCHTQKGVCWKYVLYAYGYDNWDYPDPKCPYAPPLLNNFGI